MLMPATKRSSSASAPRAPHQAVEAGDDDEDAILKLLRCQSRDRLHQLVGMPGTDVGEFDDNFDGDQWDDLESFFAANGITLD